jgi:hypothetical protein
VVAAEWLTKSRDSRENSRRGGGAAPKPDARKFDSEPDDRKFDSESDYRKLDPEPDHRKFL